jgi:hypothetical protein
MSRKARTDAPERRSPGLEAVWIRSSPDEWSAVYRGLKLAVVRPSSRSPMLHGYADGRRVFGGVRYVPTAQQRCEAMVRLRMVGAGSRTRIR